METLLRCESCGTAFEHEGTAYWAICPDCSARYPAKSGCC